MGWVKITNAAKYAGVSRRTIWTWLKEGLRYSRLPSNLILIKREWIDEFIENVDEIKTTNIPDSYIGKLIKAQYKISDEKITPEMINLKKQLLKCFRIERILKNGTYSTRNKRIEANGQTFKQRKNNHR